MDHLQLFLLLFWLMLPFAANCDNFETKSNSCMNLYSNTPPPHSTFLPVIERVFSRKKRFLLLPPGGWIKFTANFSKRLLAAYPRGMNFAYEAATYYEVITKRSDWLPKYFRERTTTAPKPAGPTKPIYVYIPGSNLRYKARPAKKPTKVQRNDDAADAVQWIDGGKAMRNITWRSYGDMPYRYRHRLAPRENWHQKILHPKAPQYPSTWDSSNYPQYVDIVSQGYNTKDLHHFHGHRERRHLFRSLEDLGHIFRVNMTACILRTICDCQHLLMPPGYSMLQDMMRVVFTMPKHHKFNDEYGHAMSGNVETCNQDLSKNCPFSLITWFLNPKKSSLSD